MFFVTCNSKFYFCSYISRTWSNVSRLLKIHQLSIKNWCFSYIFETLTSLLRKEGLRDKIHSIAMYYYFSTGNMEVKHYLCIATLRQINKREHISREWWHKFIFKSNMPYYSYILRRKKESLLASFCPYLLPGRAICNKMETLAHKNTHFCFLKPLSNKVFCIFSKALVFSIVSYISTMIWIQRYFFGTIYSLISN